MNLGVTSRHSAATRIGLDGVSPLLAGIFAVDPADKEWSEPHLSASRSLDGDLPS
jgi:hypothetical protein